MKAKSSPMTRVSPDVPDQALNPVKGEVGVEAHPPRSACVLLGARVGKVETPRIASPEEHGRPVAALVPSGGGLARAASRRALGTYPFRAGEKSLYQTMRISFGVLWRHGLTPSPATM